MTWPKKHVLFAIVSILFFSSPAFALFGFTNPCLISPYAYIKCYGVVPGTARVDIGNELLDIAQKLYGLKQTLTSLKAPKFDFSFLQFLKVNLNVKEKVFTGSVDVTTIEGREKIIKDNKDVSIFAYEKEGLRSAVGTSVYKVTTTKREAGLYAHRLGDEVSSSGVVDTLKRAVGEDKSMEAAGKGKSNVESPGDAVLAILSKLGLIGDDLATAREIAQALAKLNEEKMKTNILSAELAEKQRNIAILEADVARVMEALYADTIELSVRRY